MKRTRYQYDNDSENDSENDSNLDSELDSENDSNSDSESDSNSELESNSEFESDSDEDNDVNYTNQFEEDENEDENEFKLPSEIVKKHESGYKIIMDSEHPQKNKLVIDDYSSLYKDGEFYETEPLHTVIPLEESSGLCKQCNNYGLLNKEGICYDYCRGNSEYNIKNKRLRSFGKQRFGRRFSGRRF